MNRAVIMFVAVMSTIGAAALVVAGPEGVNRLEEQRRNLGRLEVRRDAAKRKALALEHKIAQQSEGLEGIRSSLRIERSWCVKSLVSSLRTNSRSSLK